MSDDIVKWLRFHIWTDEPTALDRAADEIERLRAELAAERERAIHQTSIACRAIEELAKLREALVKARDGLNNGGFISDRNRAAIDAVLEETKGDGDE